MTRPLYLDARDTTAQPTRGPIVDDPKKFWQLVRRPIQAMGMEGKRP